MKTLHRAAPVSLALLTGLVLAGPALSQGLPASLAQADEPGLGGAAAPDIGVDTDEVSIEYFLETLAPYGDWIMSRDQGWVWRPDDLPPGWQPFTRGEWLYTEYGWTWSSDFAWGWAPFHYGNWAMMDRYGCPRAAAARPAAASPGPRGAGPPPDRARARPRRAESARSADRSVRVGRTRRSRCTVSRQTRDSLHQVPGTAAPRLPVF